MRNITLAILDTGIDYEHEDQGNFIDGFDFVNNDADPMDDHGHGAEVSGIAAATINNGKGIAGIAQVNILALKVLDERGIGRTRDVARAIIHAVNSDADVISMSFGGEYARIMREACDYAWDNGLILVAAAGNDNSSVVYPANYTSVIAVGATNIEDERAEFSNFGPGLELVAPGDLILTTVSRPDFPEIKYDYDSGTSFSAPHVSAIAALLRSKDENLSNEEIRNRLRKTAQDLGRKGRDRHYGYGMVDAYAALTHPKNKRAIFDTGVSENPYPSISGTHKWTITPYRDIYVKGIFTYPSEGTGGHSKFVRLWGNGLDVSASWAGYAGDWRNITFPAFTLEAGKTYNYKIITGSYPQIIHAASLNATGGVITSTKFIDANGIVHRDWIPAIRLIG